VTGGAVVAAEQGARGRLRGLSGRVALVTGAGQGIGAAIAARLADDGCVVAVNSLQPRKAEATAERLRQAGGRAQAFPTDVSDPAQVDAMVRAVEESLGPVEILVNNAAFLDMVRMVEQPPEIWARHIEVDLTGPFLCARRALPGMVAAGWGRVVNISSIWGLIGARGATAYSAAKGGLVAFTRALHAEVGDHGVAVTAIAPGIIDTPQLSADAAFAGITLDEMKARYATQNLVGRIGTPEEIAGVVAFLASDDGQAFGGQTIPVTGGRSE
jgi:NAD(P)-dependent dehydrogenase (short-subunit alcohol dehydrogenase family)